MFEFFQDLMQQDDETKKQNGIALKDAALNGIGKLFKMLWQPDSHGRKSTLSFVGDIISALFKAFSGFAKMLFGDSDNAFVKSVVKGTEETCAQVDKIVKSDNPIAAFAKECKAPKGTTGAEQGVTLYDAFSKGLLPMFGSFCGSGSSCKPNASSLSSDAEKAARRKYQ